MPESTDLPSMFRILFRIFWLRVLDLESLSPDNDSQTLLGHLAALLAGVSILFTAPLILIGGPMPQSNLWTFEHLFFATTFTVVGVLAVLSWDSALPDRRDLLVLGPLPLRIRTIVAAKISALAGVLAFSVVALNFLTGSIWPLLFSAAGSGLVGAVRSIIAYWITIAAVSTFIFSVVLCLQGGAALILPRQIYLRISSLLQIVACTTLLCGYLLEPSLESGLNGSANLPLLKWLPSYCFLGLFQQVNGTMGPVFAPLAERAWTALAIACTSAAVILLVSWVVKLRDVVEQPDIVPGRLKIGRSISFGGSVSTAVVQFSMRSLLRSRQHRLLYAFYLSLGLTAAIMYTGVFDVGASVHREAEDLFAPALAASLTLLCFAVLGLRIIISVPVFVRANWIFQVTQVSETGAYVSATRLALLIMAVIPVWLAVAVLMLSYWPSWQTVVHLAALVLSGVILIDLAVFSLRKLPFACSYMPGKGRIHLVFWGGLLVGLPLINEAARLEYRLLATRQGSIELLFLLLFCRIVLRWFKRRPEQRAGKILFYEEEPIDLLTLRLGS